MLFRSKKPQTGKETGGRRRKPGQKEESKEKEEAPPKDTKTTDKKPAGTGEDVKVQAKNVPPPPADSPPKMDSLPKTTRKRPGQK